MPTKKHTKKAPYTFEKAPWYTGRKKTENGGFCSFINARVHLANERCALSSSQTPRVSVTWRAHHQRRAHHRPRSPPPSQPPPHVRARERASERASAAAAAAAARAWVVVVVVVLSSSCRVVGCVGSMGVAEGVRRHAWGCGTNKRPLDHARTCGVATYAAADERASERRARAWLTSGKGAVITRAMRGDDGDDARMRMRDARRALRASRAA